MPERELYAAIDLGSNSFHMLVARQEHGELRIIDRIKDMVRIAGGIDDQGKLDPDTRQGALDSLARFGQRIAGIPRERVRAVGTQSFRLLANPSAFLIVAETALGCAIDIISGREEARLVYVGVSQSIQVDRARRLIVDIGGGSTELAVGDGDDPEIAESVAVGCVNTTRRAFGDGRISKRRWQQAVESVQSELIELSAYFRTNGWDLAIGSSGTVRAVGAIADQLREEPRTSIDHDDIERIANLLCRAGHIDAISLPGLSARRQPVIAGGLVVLKAVMEMLDIDKLQVSPFALREGLLHDLLGRLSQRDPRARTIAAMVSRYQCDPDQAARVRDWAMTAADQVSEAWALTAAHLELLDWACQLHELGLAISHERHHDHGAYIVRHADMPGFSLTEQHLAAVLIGLQRRRLELEPIQALPARLHLPARRLLAVMRLAVAVCRTRREQDLPDFALLADGRRLRLHLPPGWLGSHPLTARGLAYQKQQFARLDIELQIAEIPGSEAPA